MRVDVKAHHKPITVTKIGIAEPQPDYPLRVSSFLASIGAHCGAIATLAALSTIAAPPAATPVYDEFIKAHKHHILLYDFREKVPDVAPLKETGNESNPRGAELSKQAIIATSQKPESARLFMSVPAPDIQIHQDLPAPLLVTKIDIKLPPPPERPKPRKFVPPPARKREQPLPIQMPSLDAPSLPSPEAASLPLEPSSVVTPVLYQPQNPTEAPTANPGNASADVAVASLHPTEKLEIPLPNGERSAQFSKAPAMGPAASGGANTAALTVPDLAIRQPKAENTPAMPTQQIRYADVVRNTPFSTLSAPLRPSSRSIPQAVEARFSGRTVYAILLPMEHMPVYAGDWIIWFADRQTKPGETPLVHGPMPLRKIEIVDQTPPNGRTPARIQVAATLRKDGRLDGVTILSQTSSAVQRAVFQDISSWEFQPATFDGASLDVDMVLEIPFSLPAAIAKSP